MPRRNNAGTAANALILAMYRTDSMQGTPYGRRVGDPGMGASPLAMAGYVGLLLLVFVTLQPFNPPPILAVTGNVSQATAGGPLHQLLSVAVFLAILGAAFVKRGMSLVRAIPLTLGLLLIWSMASAAWAINPDLT